MLRLLGYNVAWNRRPFGFRGLVIVLLASSGAWGQDFTLTRDQLIQYTVQNPYERFPDGRPKVPDSILEKVKGLSAEEALGLVPPGASQAPGNENCTPRAGMEATGCMLTRMYSDVDPGGQNEDAGECVFPSDGVKRLSTAIGLATSRTGVFTRTGADLERVTAAHCETGCLTQHFAIVDWTVI